MAITEDRPYANTRFAATRLFSPQKRESCLYMIYINPPIILELITQLLLGPDFIKKLLCIKVYKFIELRRSIKGREFFLLPRDQQSLILPLRDRQSLM